MQLVMSRLHTCFAPQPSPGRVQKGRVCQGQQGTLYVQCVHHCHCKNAPRSHTHMLRARKPGLPQDAQTRRLRDGARGSGGWAGQEATLQLPREVLQTVTTSSGQQAEPRRCRWLDARLKVPGTPYPAAAHRNGHSLRSTLNLGPANLACHLAQSLLFPNLNKARCAHYSQTNPGFDLHCPSCRDTHGGHVGPAVGS